MRPLLLGILLLSPTLLGCGAEPAADRATGPEIGGEPLELIGTNWTGDDFRLSALRGRVALVFFGYTYCPDVCPMTLAKLKQLTTDLGEQAEELAVVFASVDPHRDSVEKLAGYVPGFDRRFYGVHLDFDQLDAAQASFGLTVQYGQPKDGPGSDSYYYVDHTGSYFLLDRDGRLRVRFPPNASTGDLRPEVESLLGQAATSTSATPGARSGTTTERAGLEIERAEARVLPDVAAVYLRVTNRGSAPDRLTAVETEAAAHAMLHESREEGGVMRMAHHEGGFEVPAGGTLELVPGGRHLMLHGLVLEGDAATLPLTLRFEVAGPIEIEVPVRERLGDASTGDT